jgi:hypothetical protein
MRSRAILLLCAAALLLPMDGLAASPAGARHRPREHGPRIKSGFYASADGRVTLEVEVKRRRARFRFMILCRDPFGNQYVTPGPKPRAVYLSGNRVGATVVGNGEYSGPSESGFPGEQLTFWWLHAHFTGPASVGGRVGFETGTFPAPPAGSTPPPLARPECLGTARFSLRREP